MVEAYSFSSSVFRKNVLCQSISGYFPCPANPKALDLTAVQQTVNRIFSNVKKLYHLSYR